MPSVIRLLRYVRIKKRFDYVPFSRANIYARDGNTCQYCAKSLPTPELTFDHVVPVSQGGRKDWENIVTCCVSCNRRKGGRTPQEAHMSWSAPRAGPIRRPRFASLSDCATHPTVGAITSTGTWSWTTRRTSVRDRVRSESSDGSARTVRRGLLPKVGYEPGAKLCYEPHREPLSNRGLEPT